jgi:hypothetical protein
MRYFLFLLSAILVFQVSCGGGGNPINPDTKNLKILSFDPVTGSAGALIEAVCVGLDPNVETYFVFGETYSFATIREDGVAIFSVPETGPGEHHVRLISAGKISDSRAFKVTEIVDLPHTQPEFAETVSDGLSKLITRTKELIIDIDVSNPDIYEDQIINALIRDLDYASLIAADIEVQINNLPTDQAKFLQSEFLSTGILSTLVSFRTASGIDDRTAQTHLDKHHYLYEADTLSMLITNSRFISNTLALVTLLTTGGGATPLLTVKIAVDIVLTVTNWTLDTMIPTELEKIEILDLDTNMNYGEIQQPRFIGYFRCQNKAEKASIDLLVDLFFISLPSQVDDATKDALKEFIKDKLIELGVDLSVDFIGDNLPYNEYFVKDLAINLDMSLYDLSIEQAIRRILPGPVDPFLEFLRKIGWDDLALKRSVFIDNEGLDYDHESKLLWAGNAGSYILSAQGYRFVPQSYLLLIKFELPQAVISQNKTVSVYSNNQKLSGFWDGYWVHDNGATGDFILTLTQISSIVTGASFERSDYSGTRGIYEVSGTVVDDQLSCILTLAYTNGPPWCGLEQYDLLYDDKNKTLVGRYQCIDGDYDFTGTVYLDKQ